MNDIHSTVIIEGDVKIGKNNRILPYTIIYGPIEIGDDNIIGPHVVIGTPGQDTRNPRYDSSDCFIKIGNRNIIREFTAIQKPCYENVTFIGDDVFLMQGVHIPHDAHIYNNVVITPMCVLAGITKILDGSNIGIGATINQRCVLGHYSFVAANAAVTKNIKPFSRYIPNKPISVNEYAIHKYGFEKKYEDIHNFVIKNIIPKDKELLRIIDEFYFLHEKSNLSMY